MKTAHKIIDNYVHGFSPKEQQRLYAQAEILKPALYDHLELGSIKKMLEVGCGVGAQSSILLRTYPKMQLTSIDANELQLLRAREHQLTLPAKQANRWQIQQMNAAKLNFPKNHFDGAMLCWILEHVSNPQLVLNQVYKVLQPGAMALATEVMNSSFFVDPYCPHLWEYWQRLNDFQFSQAGDPFVGVKLRSLFSRAGFTDIQLMGRILHFDETCPKERKNFLLYWQDLMFSTRPQLIKQKIITPTLARKAQEDFGRLLKSKSSIISYTFFQCIGYKP